VDLRGLESENRIPTASAREPFREAIELGLSRGRNAMAIWQDLVADRGFRVAISVTSGSSVRIESTALRPIRRSAVLSERLFTAKRWFNQAVESTPIRRLIRNCIRTTSAVRFSYHADQSFHKGTSRSSRAASPPSRYPPGRSTGREHRGWANCIDAAQETPPSNKTRD
jgi:hypothetical protein